MSVHDNHLRATYESIHLTIAESSLEIKKEFNPDLIIAIARGGFFASRVLGTYLKSDTGKNLPIQTIGLSLYESVGEGTEEMIGTQVVRTQWLDASALANLLGRRILIVDEVDDSRTTLAYAVTEINKDIQVALSSLSEEDRAKIPRTQLAIFVVHNKLKTKSAELPADVRYFAGDNIEDRWVDYAWEQTDILLHNRLAAEQKALGL